MLTDAERALLAEWLNRADDGSTGLDASLS
jgi:hypothetical protein